MKKLAFAAQMVGVMAFVACGGGGGDKEDGGINIPDGGGGGSDAAQAACNPGTQTGCVAGEKCSMRVVTADPFAAVTECVPDGTVAPGQACEAGDPMTNGGVDNCMVGGGSVGYLCSAGVCSEICVNGPGTCSDAMGDQNCTLIEGVFDDITSEDFGVCRNACDIIAQDCPMGEGCYPNLGSNESSCSFDPFADGSITPPNSINGDCLRPAGAVGCYLNGCPAGASGVVTSEYGAGMGVCNLLCAPLNTHTGIDADPAVRLEAANGAEPNGCGLGDGGGANGQCRFLQTMYSNTTEAPITWGVCVDTVAMPGYGTCVDFNLADQMGTFAPGCVDNATLAGAAAPGLSPELPELDPAIYEQLKEQFRAAGL